MYHGSAMTNVFDHTDYRAFLAAWYREAKADQPCLSYRAVAAKVGFRSPGFFTQVLRGRSNIRLETAQGFADLADLEGRERAYFLELVAWNQARDEASAARAQRRLERIRAFRVQELDESQGGFMAGWHHAAVRELLAIHPTRDDWDGLAARLVPAVPVETVRASAELLVELGLAVRTARGLERTGAPLSFGGGVRTEAARAYFLQTLELAREALDRFPPEDRNLSWVTLSVSEETRAEIAEELRTFRDRLLEIAARDPRPARVHQLNLQFFPLSLPPGDSA